MDVRALLGVLRKYWPSIILLTLLGGVLGGVYVYLTPPIYTASSQVFLSVQGGQTTSDLVQGVNYATSVTRSYALITTSPEVLDRAIEDGDLGGTSQQLAPHVSTSIPTNTSIIQITVTDGGAVRAAAIAQAIAESLKESVKELANKDSSGNATIVATIITPSTEPTSPTSPKLMLTLALGIVAGLAIGIGQAVLRKTLDVSVRSESDIAKATDHSVVARIPYASTIGRDPIIVVNDPQSPVAEEYRRLRTNLGFLSMDADAAPVLVITSSLPQEGKSITAINIAFSFAEDDQRVLLIDADLRRPKIAGYLNLEGGVGLTTVLVGKARLEDVIQQLGPGHIDVLPLGAIPPNPVEMAGSEAMRRLLAYAAERYDVVVIDSAPVLPVADSTLLATLATGTLVVVGADRVKIPQLRDTMDSIEQGNSSVMGLILNMARRRSSGDYYHSGYYSYTYDNGQRVKNSKGVYHRVGDAPRRSTGL
ncbi:MAG: polysaccharide biosynthesis tyrosine autokinase [Actinomycetia bacterium]|nr:polysaccharide biosynthesis tyrosine autokinase [Actinomycetes bacterium]